MGFWDLAMSKHTVSQNLNANVKNCTIDLCCAIGYNVKYDKNLQTQRAKAVF